MTVLTVGQVSCGGDSGKEGDNDNSGTGFITITEPPSLGYSTVCNTIPISGDAFISPTWWSCCSGSTEIVTGVTVTWVNETTGESGKAYQAVKLCSFLSPPYPCEHTWSATIPLVLGENIIKVTAIDPSNLTGHDTITVFKSAPSYSVTGKVINQDGVGMSGIKVTLESTDTSCHSYTSNDGMYVFNCIENGSYKLTPSSTSGYTFLTPDKPVLVDDSDVTGQDFMLEAFFIAGKATYTSGIPISGYVFTLTGLNISASHTTDSSGSYIFWVPNGTYTVAPLGWGYLPDTALSFRPTRRTVTVNDAHVNGQDFEN